MSNKERFTLRSAVFLIMIKDGKILLARRKNSGWNDGKYNLIAGHLDGGETVKAAIIREAHEEVGVTIEEDDLDVVHTMHRISDDQEYIDFLLVAKKWQGEPEIKEPEKCGGMGWFALDSLPDDMVEHNKLFLQYYKEGRTFSDVRSS